MNSVKEKSKLHPSQLEIYFEQMMDPLNPHYNIGGYVDLTGELDLEKMILAIQSLDQMFDMHNVSFVFSEAEPYCILGGEQEEIEVSIIDFTAAANPEAEASAWMQERFNTPFLFDGGKLSEHALLKLGDQNFKIFMRYHHILIDGHGFTLLINYVSDKYTELVGGKSRTESYRPYKESIDDANNYLYSNRYNADLEYWMDCIGDNPTPVLTQKTANIGDQKTIRGVSDIYDIDEERQSRYKRLEKQYGSSLHQLTLMALYVYYGRTMKEDEFVFGSMAFKRTKAQWNVFGNFSGAMPFKLTYDNTLSIGELARQVKGQIFRDYRRYNLPVSHLNRSLELRKKGRQMLFEIVANYQIFNFDLNFADLSWSIFDLSSEYTNIPLTLLWRDYGEQQNMQLKAKYDLSYLSKEEARLLIPRLLSIIDQFECDKDTPITAIQLFPEEEKVLLNQFGTNHLDIPKDKTVVSLFEEQVAERPDSTAVVYEDHRLSYAELNEMANQFGHFLQERWQVQPHDKVCILLDRSERMIYAIMGVLKTGAAYLPLDMPSDQEFLTARIDYIVEASGCSLLVDEKLLLNFLTERNDYASSNLNIPIARNDLAYVIYTSGSTGKPKGVMVEHGNWVDMAYAWKFDYQLGPDTRLLQIASIAFDVFCGDLARSILFGGQMVICPPNIRLDVEELYLLLAKHRISIVESTPSLLIPIMDFVSEKNHTLPDLELLILGSDICPVQDFNNLLHRFGDQMRIINSYGTTETTIDSSYFEVVPSDEDISFPLLPIGKPLPNVELYVLDEMNQLLPLGVIGELCIGGIGVSRGYSNLPELNAKKFVDNPFKKGERMYRTGDLAKWLPDGNLELLGRIDDQVKIRGYRIELGEIESVIGECDLVKRGVVLARNDANGLKRLVAYIIPAGKFDKQAIQDYLKAHLPAYMVPSIMMEMDAFPLTSNDKINKKALPDPDVTKLIANDFVEPANELETQMTIIWKNILGIEQVGVLDDFFELGGHSLLATRLVSSIKKKMRLNIKIEDVFTKPTIRELCILGSEKVLEWELPPVRKVAARPERIPLSYTQEFIWFIDQRDGSIHHHIPGAIRLKGTLDKAALQYAFEALVQRHEVLRTVVKDVDGELYQEVKDASEWKMKQSKMIAMNEVQTSAFIDEEHAITFDLANDYMLRVHLVEYTSEDYLLVLTMHHIAADGWSMSILINELVEFYQAKIENRAVQLNELPLQYIDYVLWQHQSMGEVAMAKKWEYWKNKLQDLSVAEIETDFPRTSVRNTEGKVLVLRLGESMTSGLRQIAQKQGITLFMTMLGVLKVLLYKYTGKQDICVGSPIANRTQEELESLIGYFLNTLALRTDLGGDPTFDKVLSRVKSTTLQAYAHQEVPFEKVIELVNPERHSNKTPLFQVFFNMLNQPEGKISLGELEIKLLDLKESESKFDLSIYISEEKSDLELYMVYNPTLFTEERMQDFSTHFTEIARAVIDQSKIKIADIQIYLKEEEQEQSEIMKDFFMD